MATTNLCRMGIVILLTLMVSDRTFGQENQNEQQQQQPGLPQATDAHKLLHKDVGTWDATMKIWMQEDGEPLESKGSETNELLPGGMWLISRYNGDFAGMPFTGVGTVGYDPVEKKYIGTWVDTISPHLTILKGDYDPETKTMTTTAEGRDFESGEVMQSRHVSRYLDDNTRTFEMHAKDRGGKERKIMEIAYKRRSK
jgi:hypothetical protein